MYESRRQRPYDAAVTSTQPAVAHPADAAMDPALFEAVYGAYARQLQPHTGLPGTAGTVELSSERQAMVWIPGPGGNFMAVPRTSVPAGYLHPPVMPAPQYRDLTPQPLIDPRAQMILASGVSAGAAGAGIGWGVGQAFAGIAAFSGSSALVVIAALLLLTKFTASGGGSGSGSGTTNIHNETHVTNHTKWWGRTSTNANNG